MYILYQNALLAGTTASSISDTIHLTTSLLNVNEWITVLGPALLMVLGGLLSWFLKARSEELRAIEEKLRDERRNNYENILEPFVMVFAAQKGDPKLQIEALQKMTSIEYRKTAMKLMLVGSDEVIRAYNSFMQYSFKAEKLEKTDPVKMLELWGNLLLAIRKSVGGKKTKLKPLETMSSMISDFDELKKQSSK